MKVIKFASEEFTPFRSLLGLCDGRDGGPVGSSTIVMRSFLKRKVSLNQLSLLMTGASWQEWLTSRSNTYNLLEFDNAADLRDSIRSVHDRFLQNLDMEYPSGIFVQCWANVMRRRRRLLLTVMRFGPYTYLSGHLCMQVKEDTSTYYINPYGGDPWASENTNGKITPVLRDGCVTTQIPCTADQTRITIAFDILSRSSYYEDVKDEMKHHWIQTVKQRLPRLEDSLGPNPTIEKEIPEDVEWIDSAFYIKKTRFGLYIVSEVPSGCSLPYWS